MQQLNNYFQSEKEVASGSSSMVSWHFFWTDHWRSLAVIDIATAFINRKGSDENTTESKSQPLFAP
jgi:hypothetical protein